MTGEMTEKMTGEKPTKIPALILYILIRNPKLTLVEVSKKISKSPRTVERAVAQLVKNGQLKRVGSKKGGYWKVSNKRNM